MRGWLKIALAAPGLVLLTQLSVAPCYRRTICKAGAWKVNADLQALGRIVEAFARDHAGAYPANLVELLGADAEGATHLPIDHVPRDPWGREYLYTPPTPDSQDYDVRTLGSDGVLGGEGEAEDISLRAIRSGKL
jgi:general secretion pathway protein G